MATNSKGEQESARNLRIGLTVAGSLLILMVSLFFIGSEQKIFSRKNEYEVRLDSVSGLAEGNPVRLSGVTVGVVKDIRLPRDPRQRNVVIQLMVDKKYSERIRQDSRARLKKLGLLAGDSYIDVTPGSPTLPIIEPGNIIPAAKQTNVDALMASGEALGENFVEISYSLKNILKRVDRGEGLIGEMTKDPESNKRVLASVQEAVDRINAVLGHVQSGRGVVGKFVYDEAYAKEVTESVNSSLRSLQAVMTSVDESFRTGSGALPALLNDPVGKKKVFDLIENLQTASERIAFFAQGLQKGDGLVPRLVNDRKYADEVLKEFNTLVQQLGGAAKKLNQGEGTAGKLISDPSVYESINDILIGINESKMLRWLVRNRQQKGIETRYDAAEGKPKGTPPASDPKPDGPAPNRSGGKPDGSVPPEGAPESQPEMTTTPVATETGETSEAAPSKPPEAPDLSGAGKPVPPPE